MFIWGRDAMTSKQKTFCDCYVANHGARESAILAGYEKKRADRTAKELLSNSEVKEYISQQLKLKQKEKIATEQEILEFLTAVVRNKDESTRDRLKAVTLLGRCGSAGDDAKSSVIIIDDVPIFGGEYAKQDTDYEQD